jgi:hypothetical protein
MMRLAHGLAIGVVFACALGLGARRVAARRSLGSAGAHSPDCVSVGVHPRDFQHEAEVLSGSATFSADESAERGLQRVRDCLALAEHDPLGAMKMALAHRLVAVDSGLLASLMARWATQDFDGAYAWMKAREPGPWRDDMLARLAYLRAQADPLAAARLVVADMSSGHARDEAIISVLHQWALQDVEAAGLWAQSLAGDALRQRAAAEVEGVATATVVQRTRFSSPVQR